MVAAKGGFTEVIHQLLEYDPNVNAVDKVEYPPVIPVKYPPVLPVKYPPVIPVKYPPGIPVKYPPVNYTIRELLT